MYGDMGLGQIYRAAEINKPSNAPGHWVLMVPSDGSSVSGPKYGQVCVV